VELHVFYFYYWILTFPLNNWNKTFRISPIYRLDYSGFGKTCFTL